MRRLSLLRSERASGSEPSPASASLAEADLPLRFWAETRADVWSPDDLALLEGLPFHLDLGVDALSPTQIAQMQKAASPARYLAAFHRTTARMEALRIPYNAYLIVNYPGETPDTLEETLAACHDHRDRYPDGVGRFSAQPLKVFPGSPAYDQLPAFAERFGTTVLHPEWWREHRGPTHLDHRHAAAHNPAQIRQSPTAEV